MTTVRIWCLAIVMAVVVGGGWQASGQGTGQGTTERGTDRDAPDSGTPALAHTCLITKDVKRLVGFYEPVLGMKAVWSGETYAEFRTGGAVLAIFSAEAQEKYIPGSAEAGTKQGRDSGVQGWRCRSRVRKTSKPGKSMGQAAYHAAVGDTVHLLP